MCGISCEVFCGKPHTENVHTSHNEFYKLLQRRGPDVSSSWVDEDIVLRGFVLWQQGQSACRQPVIANNIVLLFNGDIFNVDQIKPASMSDTEWLAKALSKCETDADICRVFRTLEGPFGVIFYNKLEKQLYFARDSLGRNSLVIETGHKDRSWRISSNSYYKALMDTNIMELPTLGLFKISLNDNEGTLFPWSATSREEWQVQKNCIEKLLRTNFNVAEAINPLWLHVQAADTGAFDLYQMTLGRTESSQELFERLLANQKIRHVLDEFSLLLERSVRERVKKTPRACQKCLAQSSEDCNHSKVAILYSGGIDCSILAALANKYVREGDSIDLLNVSFQRINTDSSTDWDAPDRVSARAAFAELKQLCPSRLWNFVEVNVTRTELDEALEKHIKHLIYPLSTVLDESIGAAFWFAARGKGYNQDQSYASPARVIVIGSGADELFGGYVRHRNAYSRCSGTEDEKQKNVLLELEKDWWRIPARNLARDDRVIADHGRTARAPFIEEHVVRFVRGLSTKQRCCYALQDGIGDKLFLRLYGYMIGLRVPVFLKKRAIQFGSKIANKKQNANDESKYLRFGEGATEARSVV